MRRPILIARPQRKSSSARELPSWTTVPRTIKRQNIALPIGRPSIDSAFSPPSLEFQPDPYFDYGRYLTDEGGILIVYKDLDVRFRHTLWRLAAWTSSTSIGAIYLGPYAPLANHWVHVVALVTIAVINFLIVRKPVELYRRIEIRPDCLIIEGQDVFWRRHIEGGYPTFRPDDKGNQILGGIYGTRFVEYLTVRRFDENDRMMEVFAAHLHDAMQQQWSRPH